MCTAGPWLRLRHLGSFKYAHPPRSWRLEVGAEGAEREKAVRKVGLLERVSHSARTCHFTWDEQPGANGMKRYGFHSAQHSFVYFC